MTPEALKLLDKSGRAIHAAEVLLREGDTDAGSSRPSTLGSRATTALRRAFPSTPSLR